MDPKLHPEAKKYDRLTYRQVIEQDLKVMDITAITLCKDNDIPIIVFGLDGEGNIRKAILGESNGTIIDGKEL